MATAIKLTVLGLIVVLAALAANFGHDLAYQVNAFIVLIDERGRLLTLEGGPPGERAPGRRT